MGDTVVEWTPNVGGVWYMLCPAYATDASGYELLVGWISEGSKWNPTSAQIHFLTLDLKGDTEKTGFTNKVAIAKKGQQGKTNKMIL